MGLLMGQGDQFRQKINVADHSPPRKFTGSPKASEIQKRILFTDVSRMETRSYGLPPC
jgi:hypothetical protein